MVTDKTRAMVMTTIKGLRDGATLSSALKKARMRRGHFYSARDSMVLFLPDYTKAEQRLLTQLIRSKWATVGKPSKAVIRRRLMETRRGRN